MGFRFRKSKKIGPFRINLSKKGVGWSVGSKWFRYTQKAGGGSRTTTSIPGTGISFVQDHKSSKRSPKKQSKQKASAKPVFASSEPVSPSPIPPVPNRFPSHLMRGILWVICGFLLFSALAFLWSLTSILCLLSGLLILPVERWQRWLGRLIPIFPKIKYPIATLCFCLSVAFYGNPATAPAVAAATPTPSPAVFTEDVFSPTAMPFSSPTFTPIPTATATIEPTATPTPEPTLSPTPEPTSTPAPTPIPTSTAVPTSAPVSESSSALAEYAATDSYAVAGSDTSSEQPVEVTPDPTPEPVEEFASNGVMVWIAGSGNGKRYHCNPGCSNMNSPVEISLSDAQARGYTACKRCYG